MKRDWLELWFKMANGVQSEMKSIMATDILDFWTIYDLWLERIKEQNSKSRQAKAGQQQR